MWLTPIVKAWYRIHHGGEGNQGAAKSKAGDVGVKLKEFLSPTLMKPQFTKKL